MVRVIHKTCFFLCIFQNQLIYSFCVFIALFCNLPQSFSQEPPPQVLEEQKSNEDLKPPEKVNVKPKVRDEEISQRLKNILDTTKWFIELEVKVQEGIVFLYGSTFDPEFKKWAKDLASKTEDTVAVVNQIQVIEPPIWDFSPFIEGLHTQWNTLLRKLPSFLFGLIILLITFLIAKVTTSLTRLSLHDRVTNPLLLRVFTWAIGFGVILVGLYSVFNLMGLTTVALTVIGGTGLLGIILGIAFKEITENLLASIFLSINNPFHKGDLIEIEGLTGYVQSLTTRSTILISLEGNYIQIPNATVYRSKIRNYTSNPNRREDFIVTIGYESAISDAQEVALQVLKSHPAVLKDPEPWVLVDSLSKSTINLRIYFWLDSRKHHWLKVRSSAIRLVKRAFQTESIFLPESDQDFVFSKVIKEKEQITTHSLPLAETHPTEEENTIVTEGEDKLQPAAKNIQEQSPQAEQPEKGKNLLKDSD